MSFTSRSGILVVLAVLALVLASCGGGGGDSNMAPTIELSMNTVTVTAGGDPEEVTVTATDSDSTRVTVTAMSSNAAVATASVSSDMEMVTITGVATGQATVTVTADDAEGGTTPVTIMVTVEEPPNMSPTIAAAPKMVEVIMGMTKEVVVTASDSDGSVDLDSLNNPTSSSDATATVAVKGSPMMADGEVSATLTITGVAEGKATITAYATDNDGATAMVHIMVTVMPVPNEGPVVSVDQATVSVEADKMAKVKVTATDADDDTVTVTASSSAPMIATVSDMPDAMMMLTITGVAKGSADITVTATDGMASSTVTVKVTVTEPNVAPMVGMIMDGTNEVDKDHEVMMGVGTATDATTMVTVKVSDGNADDTLTVKATSSMPAYVTVTASAAVTDGMATLTLTGVKDGPATITVYAMDNHGAKSAEVTFMAHAGNHQPMVGAITDMTLPVGKTSDPVAVVVTDDDTATVTAATHTVKVTVAKSDENVATVTYDAAKMTFTVMAKSMGTARITVTAEDSSKADNAMSEAVTFDVTVTTIARGHCAMATNYLPGDTCMVSSRADGFTFMFAVDSEGACVTNMKDVAGSVCSMKALEVNGAKAMMMTGVDAVTGVSNVWRFTQFESAMTQASITKVGEVSPVAATGENASGYTVDLSLGADNNLFDHDDPQRFKITTTPKDAVVEAKVATTMVGDTAATSPVYLKARIESGYLVLSPQLIPDPESSPISDVTHTVTLTAIKRGYKKSDQVVATVKVTNDATMNLRPRIHLPSSSITLPDAQDDSAKTLPIKVVNAIPAPRAKDTIYIVDDDGVTDTLTGFTATVSHKPAQIVSTTASISDIPTTAPTGSLVITPLASGLHKSTTLTLNVTGETNRAAMAKLTVLVGNQPPVVTRTPPANPVMIGHGGSTTIPLTIKDPDSLPSQIITSVKSGTPSVLKATAGADSSVTVESVLATAVGSAVTVDVTITVTDDSGETNTLVIPVKIQGMPCLVKSILRAPESCYVEDMVMFNVYSTRACLTGVIPKGSDLCADDRLDINGFMSDNLGGTKGWMIDDL